MEKRKMREARTRLESAPSGSEGSSGRGLPYQACAAAGRPEACHDRDWEAQTATLQSTTTAMASAWADLSSDIGDDHPLAIELSSLRTALARYQVRNGMCASLHPLSVVIPILIHKVF